MSESAAKFAPLHRLDAEQALLGAILFDNETLHRVGALRAEHFFDPVHQRIFAAMQKLIAAGRVADGLTMRNFFVTDGGINEIGGAAYLMKLMELAAPLSAQAQAYAELVRDVAQRRALSTLFRAMDAAAHKADGDSDAGAIIVEAERKLAELADEQSHFGLWRPLHEVMEHAIDAAQQGDAVGISTGIDGLDEITGGISTDGKLWVIGGASSMGKSLVGSALALTLAKAGHGVGYVHLEMGERGAGLRAATALAHEPHYGGNTRFTDGNPSYLAARRQRLSQSGWERLREAVRNARGLPLRIDARPHQTLSQIESGARRLARLMAREGTPLKVLFIDHEGLIKAEQKRDKKWEEVSDRWIRLQGLAKKLNIAIVALTQINREGAGKEGDQRPHMGHLANSADIERCADVIMLLYREAYFAQRKPDHACSDEDFRARKSNLIELIVDKSRDGERRTVKAILDVRTGYFGEDARPEPPTP